MNSQFSELFLRPEHMLQGGICHPLLRRLQEGDTSIQPHNIMYPLFLLEDDDSEEPVSSMPGVSRYGINKLIPFLEDLVADGLQSVLLFGVVEAHKKDEEGSMADSSDNPVIRALPVLRERFPRLLLACDVCLCPYTAHGHCGLPDERQPDRPDGVRLRHAASVRRLAQVGVAYARAGAHVLAPSDMVDGRVLGMKRALVAAGLQGAAALLSYSCKFASALYGPFREAAGSAPAPAGGLSRASHQLPAGGAGLALRAAARDVAEGADLLLVKPALPYLDVVRQVRDAFPRHPLLAYQVSGEYALLTAGEHPRDARSAPLTAVQLECLTAVRRAGADCIVTYFAPRLLRHLKREAGSAR